MSLQLSKASDPGRVVLPFLQLFDASDKQIAEQTASVQRRADSNLGDLVKKLVTGYEENTKATNGIIVALGQIHDVVNATAVVGSVTIQQNDQATGLPWNPIPSIRLARHVHAGSVHRARARVCVCVCVHLRLLVCGVVCVCVCVCMRAVWCGPPVH